MVSRRPHTFKKDFSGDLDFCSNMYPSPFDVLVQRGDTQKKLHFPTVEHWYVFWKCARWEDAETVLQMTKPGDVKRFGRHIKLNDWFEEKKLHIMHEGLQLKFKYHPDLRKRLLDTYPSPLEEGNTWGDKFWGVDYYTREGENNLGKLLMEIRDAYLKDKDGCDDGGYEQTDVVPN